MSPREEEMLAALRAIVEPKYNDVSDHWYVPEYAPDSREYGGSTEPGSPWDEECDRLIAEIRAALPEGWEAEWSDDDLMIRALDVSGSPRDAL